MSSPLKWWGDRYRILLIGIIIRCLPPGISGLRLHAVSPMPDLDSLVDIPSDGVPESARNETLLRVFLARRSQMESLVTRRVGCRATAADLVQDLFLRFWRRPTPVVEDLGSYLLRSAHNMAIDHLRSEGARTRNESGLFPETQQDEHPPPEVTLQASHDLRSVSAALQALPERTRHIFLLNRIHGRTYAEIARSMAISQSAVEKHMMRALDVCKASLADTVSSPGSVSS